MTVRVVYFASLKERTGTDSETAELPSGSDVEDLWHLLTARHPRLGELRTRPAVACDLAYAPWSRALDGVAEVAFLPAVSGG